MCWLRLENEKFTSEGQSKRKCKIVISFSYTHTHTSHHITSHHIISHHTLFRTIGSQVYDSVTKEIPKNVILI